MATEPSQAPEGGGATQGRGPGYSGTSSSGDPTAQPGQYPPTSKNDIFGGPLPTGTGAPGTRGSAGGTSDPTNEPGQISDGLTGVTDAQITETGAPGTSTTPNSSGGGTSITYTRPGSFLSGTNQVDRVSDNLDGPQDSTQANDIGYGTGGPQLPGIQGNEPVAGGKYQPGSGKVLRGGRSVRG